MNLTIRSAGLAACILFTTPALAEPLRGILYKSPECTCCDNYADHLRDNGFTVDVEPTEELAEISRKAGLQEGMEGCHTMFVDGYVVSGHVPVNAVRKLLSERPDIAGLTLPGMPMGSPGMSGTKTEAFVIHTVPKHGAAPSVYVTE
jgi:hypothetical protein